MKILIILNEAPYGSERSYNGLRLAKSLGKKKASVALFLMADAVACAKRGQKVPQGFYNIELMLSSVVRHGDVLLCGACMDARGMRDEDLTEGARRSSLDDLAQHTLEADQVMVF